MDEYRYSEQFPRPIQGGDEPVTRQTGLPPQPEPVIDRTPDKPIIQRSPEIHTTRIVNPAQYFTPDGLTLVADRVKDDSTFYADGPMSKTDGDANRPPAPVADVPRDSFDVVQADQPGIPSPNHVA